MKHIITHIGFTLLLLAGFSLAGTSQAPARADVVRDWNTLLGTQMLAAGVKAGSQGRPAAIVQACVFDALNGIHRKYTPYFVTERAPHPANQKAAAVQAAYTALVALLPTQKPAFDAQLAVSLAHIHGSAKAIANGRAWGLRVAQAILDWRSHDGFTATLPPYFGGGAPGVWRSVPDGSLPASFQQVALMTPFAMTSDSQFRPGPPPALASAQYAADVNEVKALGRATGSSRTDEQTNLARLWHAVSVGDENTVLLSVLPDRLDLVDEARMLALVDLAFADGFISVLDAKRAYNFWRPFHAITLADTDGNPDTAPDPTWTSLIQPTPNHQEYPSAHAVVSGAAFRMMANLLGDAHRFILQSPGFPGFTHAYGRFSAAVRGVQDARVWGGLHFRYSVVVGAREGTALADYIFANFLRPLETDDRDDDDDDDHGD